MKNARTLLFRRRYRRAYAFACVMLAIAVTTLRVMLLGYRGDYLLPMILASFCCGLLFLTAARRTFAYRAELKRVALIENHRVYGGGNEFVPADDAQSQVGNTNIWGS